jgi:lysyl-tRNA synthetase class 2
MDLTEALVAMLATELLGTTQVSYQGREIDLGVGWTRASIAELTSEQVGEEISVDSPRAELVRLCERYEVPVKESYGPGKLLLELYEKTTESTLWEPTFVTDYPAEVSPLSRVHRSHPLLTERFEGIVAGRELCNGFSELTNPSTQLDRFMDQAAQRDTGDEEAMPIDADYVRALEYGLPPTVGLGVGIDRLVMLLADAASIRDVVLFPTLRPEGEIPLVVDGAVAAEEAVNPEER